MYNDTTKICQKAGFLGFWFKKNQWFKKMGFYYVFFGFNSAKPLCNTYPMIYIQCELIIPVGMQI